MTSDEIRAYLKEKDSIGLISTIGTWPIEWYDRNGDIIISFRALTKVFDTILEPVIRAWVQNRWYDEDTILINIHIPAAKENKL